jgi:hypothetical protein
MFSLNQNIGLTAVLSKTHHSFHKYCIKIPLFLQPLITYNKVLYDSCAYEASCESMAKGLVMLSQNQYKIFSDINISL